MNVNSRTEGGVYEVSFGYHSDLYGYATLMSDMMKLSAIAERDGKLSKEGRINVQEP